MSTFKSKQERLNLTDRHRTTSIGKSRSNTRPKNKHKRRSHKTYRGQGR